jgi:hypothetical protein
MRQNLIFLQRALDEFGSINKESPVHIVFFRDGLSKGEFKDIRTMEIEAIQGMFCNSKSMVFYHPFCYQWLLMKYGRSRNSKTNPNPS